MALTLTQFLTQFPEFNRPPLTGTPPNQLDQLQQDRITAAIFEAEIVISNTDFYGTDSVTLAYGLATRTEYAQLLLSAHYYQSNRANDRHGFGAVGQATSLTLQSNETLSYAADRFEDQASTLLGTTSYGRRLMGLQQALGGCVTGFFG